MFSYADIFVIVLIIGAFFRFVKMKSEIFVFVKSHIDLAIKLPRFLILYEMIAAFAGISVRHPRYLP